MKSHFQGHSKGKAQNVSPAWLAAKFKQALSAKEQRLLERERGPVLYEEFLSLVRKLVER